MEEGTKKKVKGEWVAFLKSVRGVKVKNPRKKSSKKEIELFSYIRQLCEQKKDPLEDPKVRSYWPFEPSSGLRKRASSDRYRRLRELWSSGERTQELVEDLLYEIKRRGLQELPWFLRTYNSNFPSFYGVWAIVIGLKDQIVKYWQNPKIALNISRDNKSWIKNIAKQSGIEVSWQINRNQLRFSFVNRRTTGYYREYNLLIYPQFRENRRTPVVWPVTLQAKMECFTGDFFGDQEYVLNFLDGNEVNQAFRRLFKAMIDQIDS